ncbi:hypothetical protein NDU88_008519 [Pleurodeles waltl]|uniref:Uncharacterized protein n=1 Tax=Pleurodeles waltl TaxID=8319 RepID=A0AAV7QRZ7_PLEWA|nr:hypothetical protein NDU88_008519 [Pleurodeles waltl]
MINNFLNQVAQLQLSPEEQGALGAPIADPEIRAAIKDLPGGVALQGWCSLRCSICRGEGVCSVGNSQEDCIVEDDWPGRGDIQVSGIAEEDTSSLSSG